MARTCRTQGSGCLHQSRPSGHHIIDQQAAGPVDGDQPSRPNLHRVLKVAGSLSMVEPCLIGNPAPEPQRRRDDDLTLGASRVRHRGTGQ